MLNVGGPGGAPIGGPLDVLGTAIRPTIEFRVDGRRTNLFEIGGMTAGENAFDGQPGPPALARIEIAGPYNSTGPGDTPSRIRIFVCRPADSSGDESDCAKRILSPIVRRAFRRNVSSKDIEPFLKTFAAARPKQSFEAAISASHGKRTLSKSKDIDPWLKANAPSITERCYREIRKIVLSRHEGHKWGKVTY